MTINNPFSRHGHRWTEEELRVFIGMWIAKREAVEIAKHFGVSVRSVYRLAGRLRRTGVPLPKGQQGHMAGRSNKPWTQEEVEYVIRRRNERATASVIAEELDRTHSGVAGMISRLREEGVGVRMLGQGVRRLWNAEKLRAAIVGRGLRLVGTDESSEEAA